VDRLTPQQLRRSAIVAALEGSSGPLRRVVRSLQDVEELTRAQSGDSQAPGDGDSSLAGPPASPALSPVLESSGRLRRTLRLSRRGHATYIVVR
jgi:hypothetical protein